MSFFISIVIVWTLTIIYLSNKSLFIIFLAEHYESLSIIVFQSSSCTYDFIRRYLYTQLRAGHSRFACFSRIHKVDVSLNRLTHPYLLIIVYLFVCGKRKKNGKNPREIISFLTFEYRNAPVDARFYRRLFYYSVFVFSPPIVRDCILTTSMRYEPIGNPFLKGRTFVFSIFFNY